MKPTQDPKITQKISTKETPSTNSKTPLTDEELEKVVGGVSGYAGYCIKKGR